MATPAAATAAAALHDTDGDGAGGVVGDGAGGVVSLGVRALDVVVLVCQAACRAVSGHAGSAPRASRRHVAPFFCAACCAAAGRRRGHGGDRRHPRRIATGGATRRRRRLAAGADVSAPTS
jgi:hypothetical protein